MTTDEISVLICVKRSKQDKMNQRRTQTIMEYIALCVVFATVGIATFMAAYRSASVSRMQELTEPRLANVIPDDQEQWPSNWTEERRNPRNLLKDKNSKW